MKRKPILMLAFAVFLFAVLPYGLIRAERAISATNVTVSSDVWPVWPTPDSKINGMEVWEPATLLSIGRDVITWVYFGARPTDDGFVSADVYYLVKKSATDGSIHTFAPGLSNADPLFIVPENTALGNPDKPQVLGGLRDNAVFPQYAPNWMKAPYPLTDTYPNEDFRDSETWLNTDNWANFVRGASPAPYKFADTGHAPPQIVWDVDPWLEAFVSGYAPPSAWNDRIVGMISTNQGTLQGFEIDAEAATPSGTRKWVAVPNPGFRQSIYHTLRRMYSGAFKRLTLMDGPFTVRDVEIGGAWKRIVVGTTGLGTPQSVKPQNAWDTLGQATGYTPTPLPTMTTPGRVFGVYAYDISTLTDTPTAATLNPIWSVSNVKFAHSGRTFSGFYPKNTTGASDYNGYADLKYSVSKPLIGYTKSGGTRTWHSVILGIDGNNKYRWIDGDPADGKNLQNGLGAGVFTCPVTVSGNSVIIASHDETQTAISDKTTYLSPEQVETLYPSRILAAFPDPAYNPQEPLLGAIYVYLSNGALYRWDLNSGRNPVWIATFQNDKGFPMAPLTDFDISYLNGNTYLAATVTFTYNGASAHETSGMIVANLTEIESMDVDDRIFKKAPPGQDGTVVSSKEDHIMMVQLQGANGAYTPGIKEVMASPVFIKEKLYLAYYEMTGKKIDMSRLYTLLFESRMGGGQTQHLVEYDGTNADTAEFYDLEHQRVVNMFVDSKGNLVLIGEGGTTLLTLPTGLVYEGTGGGGGSSLFNKMKVIYWRRI